MDALDESMNKVLFDSLPFVWFVPKKIAEIVDKNIYKCPLYKTSARRGVLSTTGHSTNYVTVIRLATKVPDRVWILRGVAGLYVYYLY